MTRDHQFRVRGLFGPVVATCTCGWVSEPHTSRGAAYRAWNRHRWYASRRLVRAVYGTDTHRRALSADQERPV
jgi:hypothetical protein